MNKYDEIIKGLSNSESFAESLSKLTEMLQVDSVENEKIKNENSELKTALANTKLELSKVLISNTESTISEIETDEEKNEK